MATLPKTASLGMLEPEEVGIIVCPEPDERVVADVKERSISDSVTSDGRPEEGVPVELLDWIELTELRTAEPEG